MYNIAIFASGNGTNAENIVKTFAGSDLLRVSLCLVNRKNAGVIDRMARLGVETVYIPTREWDSDPGRIVELLQAHGIDLIVLAGFMHLVPREIVEAYDHRIINIHPSLLPKFGGKGMYGHHVHEAVIAAGETESGVTVHYVDCEFDRGDILMQERFMLAPDETAESLEERIHAVEYSILPRAIVRALDGIGERHDTTPPATPPPVDHISLSRTDRTDMAWGNALGIKYDPSACPPPHPGPQCQENPRASAVSAGMPQGSVEPMPRNYLVLSVLAMVLCCFVPGIIAVVYSSQVSSAYYAGNIEKARRASHNAQLWIIISFCLGVLSATLYLPFALLTQSMGF